MFQEMTYTINPDKAKEFYDKLYKTALSKSDWERIRGESQVKDKDKLNSLFGEKK